ncbi:MAG: hypothetical protein ABSC20_08685, partial [Candidatus Bathyarchaeia archaeon]
TEWRMRIRVSPSFTLNIQAQTNLNSNMSTFIILQQAGARFRERLVNLCTGCQRVGRWSGMKPTVKWGETSMR